MFDKKELTLEEMSEDIVDGYNDAEQSFSDMDNLEDVANNIESGIENAPSNELLNASVIAAECILEKYRTSVFSKSKISTENLKDPKLSLKIVKEGILDKVKDIFNKLIEFLKNLWQKIKTFFISIFDKSTKLKKYAEQVLAHVKTLDKLKEGKENVVISPAMNSHLVLNGNAMLNSVNFAENVSKLNSIHMAFTDMMMHVAKTGSDLVIKNITKAIDNDHEKLDRHDTADIIEEYIKLFTDKGNWEKVTDKNLNAIFSHEYGYGNARLFTTYYYFKKGSFLGNKILVLVNHDISSVLGTSNGRSYHVPSKIFISKYITNGDKPLTESFEIKTLDKTDLESLAHSSVSLSSDLLESKKLFNEIEQTISKSIKSLTAYRDKKYDTVENNVSKEDKDTYKFMIKVSFDLPKMAVSSFMAYSVEMTKSIFSVIDFIKLNAKQYTVIAKSSDKKDSSDLSSDGFPAPDESLKLGFTS